MRTYYKPGTWNSICQRCGFEFKSDSLRLEWTGLRVCSSCHEGRHPQDLIRVPKDESSIPWSSPEPTDIFISPGEPLIPENEQEWILTEAGSFITTES